MLTFHELLATPELEAKVAIAIAESRFSSPSSEMYHADPGWRAVLHREAQAVLAVIQSSLTPAVAAQQPSSVIVDMLKKLLVEIDSEIEQRQTGGNGEDWAKLLHLSDEAHAAIRDANGVAS
jgi:hypothetical protein